MKRISLVLSVLILIICSTGCSKISDNEIIANVKNIYLNGYTSKSIGNAIDGYFNTCNVEWSVTKSKTEKIYTVEAKIEPKNNDYIEFKPNSKGDTMYIKDLYYNFEYDSLNEKVNDYVKVYGTIFDNNKLQFFQTNSIDESYVFLNRIFGQANTNKEIGHQSQVDELNNLKNKVRNAKSDDEARKIAGKNENFPLDYDYLNNNNVSKKEIISLLDDLIETEQEIDNEIGKLYN